MWGHPLDFLGSGSLALSSGLSTTTANDGTFALCREELGVDAATTAGASQSWTSGQNKDD